MTGYFQSALAMYNSGRTCALATVVQTSGSSPRPLGAQLVIRDDGYFEGSVSGGCIESAVIDEALETLHTRVPKLLHYGVKSDNPFDAGIACGGTIEVWLEPIGQGGLEFSMLEILAQSEQSHAPIGYEVNLATNTRQLRNENIKTSRDGHIFTLSITAPLRMIVIGAVHIAQTLIPMAKATGFDVTLIDNREIFGNSERFAGVKMLTDWPADALKNLKIDHGCAIVTLTHDDKFDIPALAVALKSDAFYVGALGSRKTQYTRNQELQKIDVDTARLHGPVGLNIGAKTPEEIAVSIMAEVIQVMRK